MNLLHACSNILNQLSEFVHQINQEDFTRPSAALSNSTVGQHLRHTLEFFICFKQGYATGTINYDKRLHDKGIETDKFLALSALNNIDTFIQGLAGNKSLKLEVSYDTKEEHTITIDTTAMRELIYNIEHAVHHMAIMKIGIREVASYLQLPKDFGVAASTIRYQETSASYQ